LRNFFGITDPNEKILKIALLFRNGAGTIVQRNADGSDMYIPVYTTELAVRINHPFREPKFTPVPETQTWTVGTTFSVTAVANKPSTLRLYHNSTTPFATATNAQTITASSTVTALGTSR
jgi:hypothetical protein